jgi:hypothetical protein
VLGHQAHRVARPAADVEAARARDEADAVEQPRGLGLEHARLCAQPSCSPAVRAST